MKFSATAVPTAKAPEPKATESAAATPATRASIVVPVLVASRLTPAALRTSLDAMYASVFVRITFRASAPAPAKEIATPPTEPATAAAAVVALIVACSAADRAIPPGDETGVHEPLP